MALTGNIPKEFTGAAAWHAHGVTGEGVVVAVVDTGAAPHADLTLLPGHAPQGESAQEDLHGHGTHVAGIAAGAVYGVAPGAQVLPVKVTSGASGSSTTAALAAALRWLNAWQAASPQLRMVVNISFSNTSSSTVVEEINKLVANNVPVVVAACNDADEKSPLAEYQSPIVVANLKNQSTMNSSSSCWGALTDCCVIGSKVLSCKNAPSGYARKSGTSMAAPAVAGMLALILSRWPNISEADAYRYLMDHAAPAEVKCPSGLHLIPRVELPDDFEGDGSGSHPGAGGSQTPGTGSSDPGAGGSQTPGAGSSDPGAGGSQTPGEPQAVPFLPQWEEQMIAGVSEGKALIVRRGPDPATPKAGNLYNGDLVRVVGRSGDRALVSLGLCGWIKESYLTAPAPGLPGFPGDPDEPDEPDGPDGPTDPDDPTGSDEPNDSNDPGGPGEPDGPDGPNWPETTAGVQQALTDWGFGAIVGEIDGKNGPKTKEAVRQFQAAMGLSADGITGPKTWAALKSGIITPRLTEEDMACQCGKYCNGRPNASTAGVRLLAERIWREAEKKYPGLQLFVANRAHPAPDGAIAGGQRCEQWNKERGGASGSQHKYGRAADIYGKLDGVKDSEIRDYLEELALEMNPSGGVGCGARYIVHVDVRGNKARWKY